MLAALAVAQQVACSDTSSITEPAPSPAVGTVAKPVEVDAASFLTAPAGDLRTDVLPGGLAGTLVAGGPYNLRKGPGTNYGTYGTATGGTAVAVVCTTTRTSATTLATSKWAKLSTRAWISAGFVAMNPGVAVPPSCDSAPGLAITPGVRGDDYPFKTATWQPGCPWDPWNACVRQCTSFVAWRLRNTNGVPFSLAYGRVTWGNAGKWAGVAKTLGFRVDRTPEVGAVAQWNTSSSGMGHVAWVASVSSDKRSVTIEEYNVATRGGYGRRTVATSTISNFIHLY